MNIPPDDQPPSLTPTPGIDPETGLPADIALTGQKSSKLPYIIVAVLLIAGGGFFMWNAKKTRQERVAHVKFLEELQGFEKDELGKFWLCVLGPNSDGVTMQRPDQFTARVDQQFASDFRAYPNKIREECAQRAKDAQSKTAALGALPAYTAPLDAYGKSIVGMAEALDEWAKAAPEQIQTKMVGKNVEDYGNAWHAFTGGTPSPEVIAYDQFLHCAVPDADTKYKDNLALAQHIFELTKDIAWCDKLQTECGRLVTDKPTAPTKGYKTALQKFSGEDRDVQALSAALRKGRKGKLKDNLAPVGMKWVAFREAREALLKIGADALKSE